MTESQATDLAARIERERMVYHTSVRAMITTKGQKRYVVWVTNWITRNSVAVVSADDWEAALHELV
jgi:hypothetical protein